MLRHHVTFYLLLTLMLLGCSENSSTNDGDIDSDSESDLTIPDGDQDSEWTEIENESGFDPTALVDPFIGTAGDCGQLSPAANYPFGMVRLGPDTLIRSHSGYNYLMDLTSGFSHTRIDGVGCSGVGGDVRILPGLGDQANGSLQMDKETEVALPGYYAVELLQQEQRIQAEMTVSAHAGLHRYHFPSSNTSNLFINFNDPITARIDGAWNFDESANEISGWVAAKNVCNEGQYTLYFSMSFNRAAASYERQASSRGGDNLLLRFAASDEPLLVKIGFSSVDETSAANDRDLEIPGWDFDILRKQSRQAWQQELARFEIDGTGENHTLFYTMFYRSLLTPANITTHAGSYRGTDGQTHQADGYSHYHGWSLWDTYRNKFALISLQNPVRSGEIMQSLVDVYQQGKAAWSTEHEPYPNVRTEHAASLLLDASRKHIEGFSLADAYEAILAEAETLPLDSPDKHLESSFDRWVIAQIAKELNDTPRYEEFSALAKEYENVWRDTFQTLGDDADVMHARGLYEGTLWQYRWAVVHDIRGMIELDGGSAAFLQNLTQFFEQELYNHGNEPDIHTPFLFHYVGAPWKSQHLVYSLMAEEVNQWYGTHEKWSEPFHGRIYRAQPEGLIPEMDDDDGTMAAWFVLAAIGLYPVTIGQPIYTLTTPLFEKIVLHPDENTAFTILAPGVSPERRYIQSATLNGEALTRAWLHHDDIRNGGELRLELGTTPNKQWGSAATDAPPSAFE